MIIKISRGQPELKFTLIQPGRGRRLSVPDGVRLVITAPAPKPQNRLSPIIRKGSWGWPPVRPYPPDPHSLPAIVYPAFDLDDEGAVIFRLDEHLWRRPSGRYTGEIMIGGHLVTAVDIDLEPLKWLPSKIELNEIKVCP
jgi:hypothetical protein